MVANQRVAPSNVHQGTLAKQEFVLQVIKALEEREHNRTSAAHLSLAAGAFEKLQFDFPAVTSDELQALIHHFRECVRAKSGWFPYLFTGRFTSNALAGAKCIAENQTSADQQSPSPLREPFQHIAAFIYFQYMKLVLSLPPPQAWALLARYITDDEPAVSENGVASAIAIPETCTASPQVATDDVLAAELDDDNCQYEDMDSPSTSAASAHPISSSDEISQPYSPTLLCRKLIHLSSQLEYSHVCLPSVWQATNAEESVLETLRVLGVHSQAAELRPVTQTYLAVVTEHVLACPDATPLLTRVWDALGLASALSVPRRRGPPGHSPVLAAEMDCMLNVTTSLVVRVSSARGRVQLRKQVQELLPMIDHCMEQVAGIANAEATQDGLDVLLMVADLLAFYVSEAPGGASVGASLQDSGVLRSLAILFGRYGASPPTESLRKAALLAAAGSPAVCSWLLAVPGMVQALESPAFCTAGLAEAHGAVWQMLQRAGDSPLAVEIMGRGVQAAHVDRKVQLLQLLLAAQRAANGRQLWNSELAAVLRQQLHAMTAQLHAMTTVPSHAGHASDQNGVANGHTSNGHVSRNHKELHGNGQLRGEGANMVADGNGSVDTGVGSAAGHSDSSEENDVKEHGARAPALRTPQRNIRVCVRLMKQLVVQGGKSE